MTDRSTGDESTPEDAFALLGNETRIDIVRALNETSSDSLSFSALRERVDVADSGQFNYHLDKLLDSFVRRTENGEYELTYAGHRVVGAILSGTFHERGAEHSFELDSICWVCESTLFVEYERERVSISCQSCDLDMARFGFPPGAVESRSHEELLRAFDGWLRAVHSATVKGLCLNCVGRTHGSLTDEAGLPDQEVGVEHVCERCGERTTFSVGAYLLTHPDVVAFHRDHDIDLFETPVWELPWPGQEEVTVLCSDPWRVRLTIELEDDRLELAVENDLSVSVV